MFATPETSADLGVLDLDASAARLNWAPGDSERVESGEPQKWDERRSTTPRPLFASAVILVSPEDLGALWQALEDAGLFQIPEYTSGAPPVERPFFLLQEEGGERHIFVRPEPSDLSAYPRVKQQEIAPVWGRAKLVIFRGAG